MSGGDRDKRLEALAATSLCAVCLVGITILLYALGVLNGREAERRQQTPASYSQSARQDAERSCAGGEPGAMFECVYERVEASKEQANTEQDLSAQQRAATSSLASAVIAFLTLAITAAGVWFVKRTLDATLEAVRDTSEATEAMREANKIAREIGAAQTRPYLIIDNRNIEVCLTQRGDMYYWLRVPMKNYGTTPALNPNISCNSVAYFTNGFARTVLWSRPLQRIWEIGTTIGPGDSYRGIWQHSIRPIDPIMFNLRDYFSDESNGPISLCIDVLFTYLDIYDRVQGSEFYRIDATIMQPGEFSKTSVIRLKRDPQGAGDIYD